MGCAKSESTRGPRARALSFTAAWPSVPAARTHAPPWPGTRNSWPRYVPGDPQRERTRRQAEPDRAVAAGHGPAAGCCPLLAGRPLRSRHSAAVAQRGARGAGAAQHCETWSGLWQDCAAYRPKRCRTPNASRILAASATWASETAGPVAPRLLRAIRRLCTSAFEYPSVIAHTPA